MIDLEIQNFVRQEISQAQKNARYDTTNAVYHIHNGIDSPILPSWIIAGNGLPTIIAPKGTIYINKTASNSGTSRIFISTSGTAATWAYLTASA